MRKYISLTLVLALCSAFVHSCAMSDDIAEFVDGDYVLNVSGKVVDKSGAGPVSGIQVILETFKTGTFTALSSPRDTAYSAADGSFSLQVSQHSSDSHYYRLTAKDVDGSDNGGYYKSAPIDIYLVDGSMSYDSSDDSYNVTTEIEMLLSSSPL